MRAGDVMSGRVIAIAPEATVLDAIKLMLDNRISGLPVIDGTGALVGIVTEGDFLRRAETGTERKPARWLQFFMSPDRLAGDYVRTHGRKVAEVMTPDPVTVGEDTPLDEVVRIMERQRIKRLPVVRNKAVVGVISRANLLRALASVSRGLPPPATSDAEIRQRLDDELARQPWAPIALIDFIVKDGVVEFWGDITGLEQEEALKVCAETVPGVKAVVSHLNWVEPII